MCLSSMHGIFPIYKGKRTVIFSTAKQNIRTHTEWSSIIPSCILFLKLTWRKAYFGIFVFNRIHVAYCSADQKIWFFLFDFFLMHLSSTLFPNPGAFPKQAMQLQQYYVQIFLQG